MVRVDAPETATSGRLWQVLVGEPVLAIGGPYRRRIGLLETETAPTICYRGDVAQRGWST